MPGLLGFPKVGIWGNMQEPFQKSWVQVRLCSHQVLWPVCGAQGALRLPPHF